MCDGFVCPDCTSYTLRVSSALYHPPPRIVMEVLMGVSLSDRVHRGASRKDSAQVSLSPRRHNSLPASPEPPHANLYTTHVHTPLPHPHPRPCGSLVLFFFFFCQAALFCAHTPNPHTLSISLRIRRHTQHTTRVSCRRLYFSFSLGLLNVGAVALGLQQRALHEIKEAWPYADRERGGQQH